MPMNSGPGPGAGERPALPGGLRHVLRPDAGYGEGEVLRTFVHRSEGRKWAADYRFYPARFCGIQYGNEIKEWYALAAYLRSFGEDGIPQQYAAADGRKEVSHSWNPIELVKNPNWITLVAWLVLALVIAGAVLLVRTVIRWRKNRRYGGLPGPLVRPIEIV